MADVLNLENLKVLWENINEKFARKDDNNIPTRTVFAYKTCKGVPLTPIGGSWNYKTNEITYPINHPEDLDPNPWGGADNIERPVWMSTKTFAKEPGAESAWSTPTMISGENGSPGADGTNVEFVYKRTKNEWEKPGGTDPDYSLNLPSPQENGYVPEGWNPSPEGITAEVQCEWQLNRTKLDDGSWGRWMGPYLWSKWGVNGQDGDGVEYVYRRTNTAIPPTLTLHAGVTLDSDRYQGRNAYIGIEYVPVDWLDNPEDVTEEFMWCWVSSRKRKDWKAYCDALQKEIDNMNEQLNDTENPLDQETIDDYNKKIATHTATIDAHKGLGVSWGAFSQPTLWAKYGEKGMSGYSVKNMYVATSLGYDWVCDMLTDDMRDGKEPLSSVWQEWPEYDRETEDVWGITATWDDIHNQLAPGTRWKGPFLASGVKGKDGLNPNYPVTIFASSPSADIIPPAPHVGINYKEAIEVGNGSIIIMDPAGNEFKWSQAPTGGDATTRWFVCNGVIDGDTGEAMEWGDVKPYNGLDGEALPGKYTEYRYCYTDLPDVRPMFDEMFDDEDGNPQYVWDPETQGEAYNRNWKLWVDEPAEGEKKYLWQIWAIKDPNTQTIQKLSNGRYWLGPIRVSGEPGESVTGKPGPSGVPGAEYTNRYQIGNVDGPMNPWDEEYKFIEDLSGQGWDQTIAKNATNADYPYIWCIQAKFVSEKKTETYTDPETGELKEREIVERKLDADGWSDPFRMSGLNSLDQPGAITLYAALDNQMDSVPCDEDGKVTQTNLGIQTTFHVYKGINDMPIDKVEIDGEIDGITYTIEGATLTINEVSSNDDRIVIPLKAYVTEGDQVVTYKQAFTLNKVHLGAPTFVADFGNENITIPADQFGIVLPNALPIQTSLNLYLGTKQINDFTITPLNDKVTVATNNHNLIIDITRDLFTEEILTLDFDVEGRLDDKTYKKTITLRLVVLKQGSDSVIYELMPNSNNIIYTTDGKFDPPILEVSAMRKHGAGEAKMMTIADLATEGITVNYRIDKGDEGATTLFPQNGLNLDGKDLETSIELSLVNNSGEVIDKETLYVLHDGVAAVRYYLQLNRDVVQYDASGKATDTADITCELIKIDGTEYTQLIECPQFFDLKYSVDGSALKEYNPGTPMAYNSFSDNLDFYLFHNDADGSVLLDHDTVIVMKVPQGKNGRIIYPAGTYDNTKIYETTPEMAPYVFDPMDKNFYLLDKETVWVGETQNNQTPSENWNDGNNADFVWKKFERYEAIYSEIGVFGQALVGSAVFCGDYVFSQQGKEWNVEKQAYTTSTNYHKFDLDDVWGDVETAPFIPNILFDFASGNGWIGGKKMSWRIQSDGDMSVKMNGVKLEWQDIDNRPNFEDVTEEVQSQADAANAAANAAQKLAEESKDLSDHTIDNINGWADDKVISFQEQKDLINQGANIHCEYLEIIKQISEYHTLVENNWDSTWVTRLDMGKEDFIVKSLGDPNNIEDPATVPAHDMNFYSVYPNVIDAIMYHTNSSFDPSTGKYTQYPLTEEELQERFPHKDIEINEVLYNYITAFYTVKTRVLEEFSTKSANFAEALADLHTGAYFTEWSNDGLINEQEMNSIKDELEFATNEHNKTKEDYATIASKVSKPNYDENNDSPIATYRSAWTKYNTTMTYYSSADGKDDSQIEVFDDKKFIKVVDGDSNANHDGYWGNIGAYFAAKQGMLDYISELHAYYAELQSEAMVDELFDDLTADGYISEAERNALILEKEKITEESTRIKNDITSHNSSVDGKTTNGKVPSGEAPSEYKISTAAGTKYANFVTYTTKAIGAINYHIGEKYDIGDGEKDAIAVDGNKGIKIKDEYWQFIADYYIYKQQLLDEYNGKKGSWEAARRFGTKTVYIGDTGLYAGTIMADNIKGWRIAGLSLESSEKGTIADNSFAWWDWSNIDTATKVEDAKTNKNGGTGPKFQFRSDGTGHIASGNIWWDASGNLTIKGKVNGTAGSKMGPWQTFESGTTKYIGDNSSTSNCNNYFGSDATFKLGGGNGIIKKTDGSMHFGKADYGFSLNTSGDFTLDKNTVIQGSNIADGAITSSKIYDGAVSGGKIVDGAITTTKISNNAIVSDKIAANAITAGKINAGAITAEKIQAGAITAEKIKAGEITAEKLNINEVSAAVVNASKGEFEELIADQIKAVDITTDRLNTTPGQYGAGTVVVEGNDIKIYDRSQSNEILRLTGDYLGSMPDEATVTITGSTKTMIDLTSNEKIGDYFTDNGSNSSGLTYKLSGVKKVTTYSVPNDGYSYGYTGTCSCSICFGLNRRQTNNTSKWLVLVSGTYEVVAKGSAAPAALTSTTSPQIVAEDIFKNGDSWSQSGTFYWVPNLKSGGEFDVYLKYFVELICDNAGLSTTEFDKILIDSSHQYVTLNTVTLNRSINRCDISSYGFRYIVDKNKYVIVDKYGSFKFKNGSYELVVDTSGIGMAFDGIDNGALKRIKPVYKEWRTTGKNVKGYVLVLGDWSET